MWTDAPLLYAGAAIMLCALLWSMAERFVRDGPDRWTTMAVPVIFSLVICGQTLLALKQYKGHYLIPAIPVAGLGIVWVVWLFTSKRTPSIRWTWVRIAALAAVCVYASNAVNTTFKIFRAGRETANPVQLALETELAKYPDAIIVGAYRVPLQIYAIQFGLGYTRSAHGAEASAILREALSYNRWNKKLLHPRKGWLPRGYLDDLTKAGVEVLLVFPVALGNAGFSTEFIRQVGKQNIYRAINNSE
jgi:hypothetical protein